MNAYSSIDGQIDVSVLVVTYNHERYIEAALESVTAQRTERTVEIILSEDCSTDGTRAIVTEFAAREPRARVLLSPRNLRSNEVVARGIRAARGRYVCLLDGDDYWVSPTKLERQAAILDQHPELSACFHNAEVVDADGVAGRRWTPPEQSECVGIDDLWLGNPFATCAGMMRTSALAGLGPWYDGFFPITDWPLYILCAEHGDIGFVDEVVGAYRVHEGGMFTALPGRAKLDLIAGFYRRMTAALDHRVEAQARAGASRYFLDWAKEYAATKDRRMATRCLALSLRSGGRHAASNWREMAGCAARLVRP